MLNAADHAAVSSRREFFVQLSRALVLQARSASSPIRWQFTYGSSNTPAESPPPNFSVVLQNGVLGVVADVCDDGGGKEQHERVQTEAHSEGGQEAETNPVHDTGYTEIFTKVKASSAQILCAQLHVHVSCDGDGGKSHSDEGVVSCGIDGGMHADASEEETGF